MSLCVLHFKLLSPQFEEMNSELEENTELAENRLIELQKLQQDLQNVQHENNNMKVLNSPLFWFYCSENETLLRYIWRIFKCLFQET